MAPWTGGVFGGTASVLEFARVFDLLRLGGDGWEGDGSCVDDLPLLNGLLGVDEAGRECEGGSFCSGLLIWSMVTLRWLAMIAARTLSSFDSKDLITCSTVCSVDVMGYCMSRISFFAAAADDWTCCCVSLSFLSMLATFVAIFEMRVVSC